MMEHEPTKTEIELNGTKITVINGDITKQKVDAIVNAANNRLAGGGGVDGAIHRATGWEQLQQALRKTGHCKTGEAVITPGFNLPAKFIIHTVGPVYGWENGKEAELLANCYKNSLKLANKHGIKTIAFPAISTGAYEYDLEDATSVAVAAIHEFLLEHPGSFDEIRLVFLGNWGTFLAEEKLAKHFRGTQP